MFEKGRRKYQWVIQNFFNLADIFNIMLVETAPSEDGVDLHWYDVYSDLGDKYNGLRFRDKFDCIVDEIKRWIIDRFIYSVQGVYC